MTRVTVPEGQTPLNDKLGHRLLDVFREGQEARKKGTGSPYHGHSLEHCIHAAGWVQQDLRMALDMAQKAAVENYREPGEFGEGATVRRAEPSKVSWPVSVIEAIEKAMEGVTPGPWKAEGYVVMGDWHASGGIASIRSGARAFADANFIAACNPVAMREVLALARQAEALQRENADLREALQPFARHKTADGLRGPDSLLYIPDDHPLLFNGLGNDARATVTVGDIRRARALLGGSENAK